jgi:hypothetical protein
MNALVQPVATALAGAAAQRSERGLYLTDSRQLFRVGRISLLSGITFLGVAVAAREFLAGLVREKRHAWLLEEGLVTSGGDALWRPLGIFLYDRPREMNVRVLDTAERGAA